MKRVAQADFSPGNLHQEEEMVDENPYAEIKHFQNKRAPPPRLFTRRLMRHLILINLHRSPLEELREAAEDLLHHPATSAEKLNVLVYPGGCWLYVKTKSYVFSEQGNIVYLGWRKDKMFIKCGRRAPTNSTTTATAVNTFGKLLLDVIRRMAGKWLSKGIKLSCQCCDITGDRLRKRTILTWP